MSAPINDGGPAFPIPDTIHPSGQVQYGAPGMTLRDYFAGKALSLGGELFFSRLVGREPEDVALRVYRIADAMLAERAKGQNERD